MIMAIAHDDTVELECMICVRWQVTYKNFPSIAVQRPDPDHIMLEFDMGEHIEFLGIEFEEVEHILLRDVGFFLFGYWEVGIAHQFFR